MADKVNQAQLRFTDSQLLYIDKAHQHYQKSNKEIITRSEFMRRMLMVSCAMELGDLVIGKQETQPEVPVETKVEECTCSEVYQRHMCGR